MPIAWFPAYIGDYDRDTQELTLSEHGAYWMLLKHYYSNGGPIAANADRLLTVCRAFAEHEKAAVLYVLSRFFVRDGDNYRHSRCDRELAKQAQLSEKRRDAGKKGASKTNLRYPAIAAALADQMPVQLPTQSQSQSHIKEKAQNILSLREYALGICQQSRLPSSDPNLKVITACLDTIKVVHKLDDEPAASWLRDRVEEKLAKGESIDRFWFENARYEPKPEPPEKPKRMNVVERMRKQTEEFMAESAARAAAAGKPQ